MDGQFSAFVTPSGGGLFAYNAPESQFPGGPPAPGAPSQKPATSPQGQSSPVAAPQPQASPVAAQPASSPTPPPQQAPPQQTQQQPAPQQPPAQAADPPAQPPAAPQQPPQTTQQSQPAAPQPQSQQPAPPQVLTQQPKPQTPVHVQQPSSSSLLESLLNDTYQSAPTSGGFDTSIQASIGNANNLTDIRLENMGPSAQAFIASQQQSIQQQAQQLHQQQTSPSPLPNFLQFQHQASSAAAPQQYMQQATAAHFLQQNAALLAQQSPLLAQQSPLLAHSALMQNVYSKYGLGAPGYPTPIKTPGAPIKTTDSDKGPEGCNLFVFHIPNDMTNLDLYQMFSTFGQVISARIMVDKVTGRSRGFGFVSYNNPDSAEQAIKSMNGFVVGHKRLKVEQKKDKNSVMPPSAAHPGAAYYATLQRWQMHLHNQAHAHLQAQAHQVPPAAATAHYLAPPTGLYPSS